MEVSIDTEIDTKTEREGNRPLFEGERRENRTKRTKKEPTFGGFFLAPQVGLEPTTLRLTAECSAIELLRNMVD